MSEPRFGCTTATFGGKLPQKLSAMKSAGFVATEFWPRDLFEHAEGPEVAVELLRENGLQISVFQALRNFEGMPREVRARKLGIAEQLMDQMALLGADVLALCSNTAPESSGDGGRIAEDLAVLGDLARSRGVRVAYEPLSWGRWVRDYRDGWSIIEQTAHDNIGMMLDCFHIFALDLPLDGIDTMRVEKIFLVEIADLPQTRLEPVEISRHYRLFPGEGVTPVGEFLRRVQAIGYRGLYSVEVFNDHYSSMSPDAVAAKAMTSMRSLFTTGVAR